MSRLPGHGPYSLSVTINGVNDAAFPMGDGVLGLTVVNARDLHVMGLGGNTLDGATVIGDVVTGMEGRGNEAVVASESPVYVLVRAASPSPRLAKGELAARYWKWL